MDRDQRISVSAFFSEPGLEWGNPSLKVEMRKPGPPTGPDNISPSYLRSVCKYHRATKGELEWQEKKEKKKEEKVETIRCNTNGEIKPSDACSSACVHLPPQQRLTGDNGDEKERAQNREGKTEGRKKGRV